MDFSFSIGFSDSDELNKLFRFIIFEETFCMFTEFSEFQIWTDLTHLTSFFKSAIHSMEAFSNYRVCVSVSDVWGIGI